ncbi:uncharacterized protein LOC134772967 [Penaeus indicus]|uniref:uncharacterized protein LOC134772967 n=1 Tax=Penaeus indicus TaxID=29960 RepID=UPI00300D0E89
MSRRLWNLLEWLVPDQGGDAATTAPTAPAATHQEVVRPGAAGRRTHTPRRPTTPTLSASGGIYQAGGQGLAATQLRSSVSYTEGCVDRRYDTGEAAKNLLEKLRTKTPAKPRPDAANAASAVTNNNENEVKPESKNVSGGGEKRKDEAKGSVGASEDEAPVAGRSRRRSLPGSTEETPRPHPHPSTRFSLPRKFSMQASRRSSAIRRRVSKAGADVMRPSADAARDKESGPPHAAQRADVISTSDEDDETRARGQIRRKPTKTRSDYSLHLDDSALGSSSTDTPEILSDPPRGCRDVAPGILTFSTGQLSAMTSSVRDAVTSMAREAVTSGARDRVNNIAAPSYLHEAVLSLGDGRFSPSTPGKRDVVLPLLHGDPRPPTTPTAAPLAAVTPTSSLRSNLKHKGQLRRKRSDSGHSVTFDLPEDCDNLGGAKARFRDDAEPLSKCMKEQCNRSKQSSVKKEATDSDRTPDAEELPALLARAEAAEAAARACPRSGEGDAPADGDLAAGERTPDSILDSDLSTTHILSPEDVLSWPRDDSQIFTWHQPLQQVDPVVTPPRVPNGVPQPAAASQRLHLSLGGSDNSLDQNITSLSDDGQTFCLNLPPLPPPRCSPLSPQFLPSLTWSSGESGCSGGSSARGPDSGYWGTGEGAVGTGRRGVKVVTQGRELYLPYAFLHHGRLRLRIVRAVPVGAASIAQLTWSAGERCPESAEKERKSHRSEFIPIELAYGKSKRSSTYQILPAWRNAR